MFFFFNDTATTEIYTLSLHDALPIYTRGHQGQLGRAHQHLPLADGVGRLRRPGAVGRDAALEHVDRQDRKSTRLNSSHANISYAVFCLKKKKRNVNRDVSMQTAYEPS